MSDSEKRKKIYEGAEAEVFIITKDKQKFILKKRKNKNYREPSLDKKIIGTRLRKEAKIYELLKRAGITCPEAVKVDEKAQEIVMTYFDLPSFRKTILKNPEKIKLLGKEVAKMHNANIVHGDITLENVLFDPKKDKPVFIDFGLSFISLRADDFATDLYVFKEMLNADFEEHIWNDFINAYEKEINKKEIVKHLGIIEKRRKYMG